MKKTFERHIVLVAPNVHWNTGNIGRTCVGAGASLHLIEPLGFSLDSKQVKRAGLDYWSQVKLSVWRDFTAFETKMNPTNEEVAIFTKKGQKPFWDMKPANRCFLIFGSETQGLPDAVLERYPNATYHIPITKVIRSLNLSTAVGIALYETMRKGPVFHQWPPP